MYSEHSHGGVRTIPLMWKAAFFVPISCKIPVYTELMYFAVMWLSCDFTCEASNYIALWLQINISVWMWTGNLSFLTGLVLPVLHYWKFVCSSHVFITCSHMCSHGWARMWWNSTSHCYHNCTQVLHTYTVTTSKQQIHGTQSMYGN